MNDKKTKSLSVKVNDKIMDHHAKFTKIDD